MADQKDNFMPQAGGAQQSSPASGQSGSQSVASSRQQGRGGSLRRDEMGASYIPSPAEFFGNPFAAMRRMHEDMDRIFAQAFGGSGGGLMSGGATESRGGGGMSAWSPAIEVKQQGGNFVVCAELPGLKPEEVQVEVNEDALIIQGERRQEQNSDQGGLHRSERRYGHFYRSIPLPEGVDADQAKAAFRDGMLEVTVPVPQQQSRRRQIPVNTGSTQNAGGAQTGGSQQTGGASKGA